MPPINIAPLSAQDTETILNESGNRFTFHTKQTKNLFNTSKNIFEKAAKGYYTSNTARKSKNIRKTINVSITQSIRNKERRSSVRTRRTLFQNNVWTYTFIISYSFINQTLVYQH